jgi:hypothetical protein
MHLSSSNDAADALTDASLKLNDAAIALTDAPLKLNDAAVALTDAPLKLNDAAVALTDAPLKLNDAAVALTGPSLKLNAASLHGRTFPTTHRPSVLSAESARQYSCPARHSDVWLHRSRCRVATWPALKPTASAPKTARTTNMARGSFMA